MIWDLPHRGLGKGEVRDVIFFAYLQHVASISVLKKNPMGSVAADGGQSVAIRNSNEPSFYCVPAKAYEALMARLEHLELIALFKERENDPTIKVPIDDL